MRTNTWQLSGPAWREKLRPAGCGADDRLTEYENGSVISPAAYSYACPAAVRKGYRHQPQLSRSLQEFAAR